MAARWTDAALVCRLRRRENWSPEWTDWVFQRLHQEIVTAKVERFLPGLMNEYIAGRERGTSFVFTDLNHRAQELDPELAEALEDVAIQWEYERLLRKSLCWFWKQMP